MTPFTTNQWIVVALVLVAGWLLGLLSRSGGAKWRRQYESERDALVHEREAHTRLRHDFDAHMAKHNAAADLRTADTRTTGDHHATTTETHVSPSGQRTVVTRD